MPHKRNPTVCERVCGLAKIMRSLAMPALENVPTWHERDLTQSSAERFVIPEACILTDYMLVLVAKVLERLQVDEKRMLENMQITQGRMMSEAVMLALARKGMNRQEVHELIRGLAMKSEVERRPFKKILVEAGAVRKMLNEGEIDEALDPRNYLGTAIKQVEMAVKRTKRERKARRLAD